MEEEFFLIKECHRSHYIHQTGLKILMCLLQLPKFWTKVTCHHSWLTRNAFQTKGDRKRKSFYFHMHFYNKVAQHLATEFGCNV